MDTTTRQTFIPAAELRAGDRLTKHGVTIATVGRDDRGNVAVTYTHKPGVPAAWLPSRRFHVSRAA
jgi:hypothetical protein